MKKLNILLIGSGGRENALAKALNHSNSCKNLWAAPGNPGVFNFAMQVPINANEFDEILLFCQNNKIDLVVIGPEQPLALGLTDLLEKNGINVFGPSQKAAQLESSKAYSKEIMYKYNIPTAKYKIFNKEDKSEALKYLYEIDFNIVLKASGLAAGKGVIIPGSKEEAIKSLNEIFEGKFGKAGDTVVIEEFMEGEEASLFVICDGKDYVSLAPAQDHKRIYDGDLGPNTGGMGAYAPAIVVNQSVLESINKYIIEPLLKGMDKEGNPFKGCLFIGLMIKDNLPRVIEFNVRFGDPETQSVLSLFEGDFAALLFSAATGNLDKSFITNNRNGFACNVILASEGYPDSYETGFEIHGLENASLPDVEIFHSGTKITEGKIVTNGGRVLSINAQGYTIKEAIDLAYMACSKISYKNIYYRKDIGHRAIKK